MTTYRLWPSTNGPSSATGYSGNFISGMQFCVTGEAWFQGYWWWVAGSGGQNTTATKCALWQADNGGTGHLIPGSVVTSGTLTAGAWNYIPLAAPLSLSPGGSSGLTPPVTCAGNAQYIAAVGCNGPFPDTNSYWGTGQVAPAGIQDGPLLAFSGSAAAMPSSPNSFPQGLYSVAGSDPSVTMPTSSSNTDNFWVDVQVSDYSGVSAAGPPLRLWPNFPVPAPGVNNDTTIAVSATAFSLSRSCTLDKIWMYSPSNSTGLATRTGIWDTDTQTEVSGTDNASPSWSGTAASGWIYVNYSASGVTLPPGNYSVAYFNGNGDKIYFDTPNYFFAGTDPKGSPVTVGGPAWDNISYGGGILTAPSVASGPELVYDDSSGTKPGNGAYQPGNVSWQYPSEFEASADWGETRWADVEVTPVATTAVVPPVYSMRMMP